MDVPTTPTTGKGNAAGSKRVRRCFELLLEGYTAAEIVRLAASHCQKPLGSYGRDEVLADMATLSDRSVRAYCHRAKKELAHHQAMKFAQAFGCSLARREHMYRKAMNMGRVNTALRVQDSIDRLHGIGDIAGGGAPTENRPQGIKLPSGQVVYL